MVEAIVVLFISLLIIMPWWYNFYRDWRFNLNYSRFYSAYNFRCPCCKSKSDKLEILDFDDCCHDLNGNSGIKVRCFDCGR